MSNRSYWLTQFSGQSWNEFLKSGGQVSGFREKQWSTVSRIKPGDYLLCYIIKLSRLIGIMEVISEPYYDNTKIWEEGIFPCRVKVKKIEDLTPETAVPITTIKDKLVIFQNLNVPRGWAGRIHRSPTKLNPLDGEVIIKAIIEAKTNPIVRPFKLYPPYNL